MAKRKKVVIVDQELTSTTLATVTDKKKTSIFGIFWLALIFAIFIGSVIYIDDVIRYVNEYVDLEGLFNITIPSDGSIIEEAEAPSDEEDEISEVKEYTISDELKINTMSIALSDFNILDGNLNVTATNTTGKAIAINDGHYYLYLYDAEKTLKQTILVDEKNIPLTESIKLSYKLTSDDISLVKFVLVTEAEYPDFKLDLGTNGFATYICTKDNDEIKYIFTNAKLGVIVDSLTINEDEVEKYQTMAQKYQETDGINAMVTNDGTSIKYTTTINLASSSASNEDFFYVYSMLTKPNVIKFELNSRGYDCK